MRYTCDGGYYKIEMFFVPWVKVMSLSRSEFW